MLERFTWYRQSAFGWSGQGLRLYIDPWAVSGDEPAADVILITHAHDDHFDPEAIDGLRKEDSIFVAPRDVATELSGNVRAIAPGDGDEVGGVRIQTVPAYNIVEGRTENHPKANGWVGYLLELDGRTYYHAGDTDHLPELESIDTSVAFLPIGGGGFTMDAGEAAGLAKAIGPDVAVPMHFGGFFPGTAPSSDAEVFRREASPIEVEVLHPRHPFPD
jgi:L-ascorbate metabolism protein UlaG (beta-lactamase superfamily)